MGQMEEGHQIKGNAHHGYLHYQIYVENNNPIRFSAVKKAIPGAHIEPRKGTKRQAYDYCSKADTRIAGPFIHGIDELCCDDHSGQRADLDAIRAAIIDDGRSVDDLLCDPDMAASLAHVMNWARGLEQAAREMNASTFLTSDRHVAVHYIWGEPGIGKTWGIKHMDNVYELFGARWDGYSGQNTVLMDEFDGSIPLRSLNRWLEGYRSTLLPARYHDLIAAYSTVYIVSNDPPEAFYAAAPSWMRRLSDIQHVDFWSLHTDEDDNIAVDGAALEYYLALHNA
jgi:hypothetical protein